MNHYRTILGIDEAGLGPILGPLTIGWSAFRLPDMLTPAGILKLNLWDQIGVSNEPSQRKRLPVVCDSKKLYTPSKGVGALEEEVLSWLRVHGLGCDDYAGFVDALCPLVRERPENYDWYNAPPDPFPLVCMPERAILRANRLAGGLEQAGCELLELGVNPLFEGELNRLMRRLGNKSRAEFEGIGRIIGPAWEKYRQLAVVCDRQGGRTRYAGSLRAQFPEAQIEVFVESKEISTYELTIPEVEGVPRMFMAFMEKGDRDHLPIALASMLAKYARELFMHQFNAWFHNYDADLKPTAGYYKDGRRWLEETTELRNKIGIDDARLIRQR